MVLKLDEVKKLKKQETVQEMIKRAENMIDQRIKRMILNQSTELKFSIVAATPNSTLWSGFGPLYLNWLSPSKVDINNIEHILKQVVADYVAEGYAAEFSDNIDVGMGESAWGIYLTVPNIESEEE